MPRFARCIRRRTRRQRLPAPVPRLPPRPTRPQSGPTARKAAPQPASMRVGRNGLPMHRRSRETRGAPAFGFLTVRFFNSAAVTPHAAKNSPAGSALFHAVIRCALLLTTTTAAANPTAKTPAPDVGAQRTPRSGRFLAPTIPAEPRFRMPVRSNAPSAKWAHAGSLSKKDTPTGKTHKALMDIWRLDIKIFAPSLRAKSTCFKGLLYKNVKEFFIETCFASFHRCESVLQNGIF